MLQDYWPYFALAGSIAALAILVFYLRRRWFIPVARNWLVDSLEDGILVLDARNRVLDFNPAALQVLDKPHTAIKGKAIEEVYPGGAVLPPLGEIPSKLNTKIYVAALHQRRQFEVQITPLYNKRQRLQGRLLIFHDVTEQIQATETLYRRDAILEAISFAATRFQTSTDWERELQEVLEKFGETTRASRAYIFQNYIDEFNRLCTSLSYEWCAEGISPQIDNPHLQNVPYRLSAFHRWSEVMQAGGMISGNLEDLPEEEQTALAARELRSLLLVPITLEENWWGFIGFDDCRRDRNWSQAELDALEIAASSIAAAILRNRVQAELKSAYENLEKSISERTEALGVANTTLQDDLEKRKQAEFIAEQRTQQLAALHQATTALLETIDLEPLLSRILDAALSAIPAAQKGMLHMIAQDTGQLEMRVVFGYSDPRIQKYSQPKEDSYLTRAVASRRPVKIDDTLLDPLGHYQGEITEVKQIRSMLIAPLISGDVVYGALSLESSLPSAFTEPDMQLLVSFGATATAALRNAQLHASVQKLAITDPLTGIYNRRGFEEFGRRLFESARRFKRPLSLILLDIDHFKAINDSYGHSIGDQVLQSLAERLNHNIREVDLMSRYGGDEFMVLLPETDIFTAIKVAERLRSSVEASPLPTEHGHITIQISVGVAKLSTQTNDLNRLLELADMALYNAKQNGRNRVRMFPIENNPAGQLLEKAESN
jgi:diguanylate cyclase (GGDEF)-like protein